MADLFCIKAESRRKDWNIMKTEQNIILDFSHIYPEDIEKQVKGLKRIDLTDISGTDMYCTGGGGRDQKAAGALQSLRDPFSGQRELSLRYKVFYREDQGTFRTCAV